MEARGPRPTPSAARVHVGITDRPISADEAGAWATDPEAGAVVVFTGTVRATTDDRSVAGLTYETYRERAEPQLVELAGRVTARWPDVLALWMVHREGSLAIGEPAVVVAASAPHREAAFAATAWAIDTLKAEVAIWKQEHWSDGDTHWPGTD